MSGGYEIGQHKLVARGCIDGGTVIERGWIAGPYLMERDVVSILGSFSMNDLSQLKFGHLRCHRQ